MTGRLAGAWRRVVVMTAAILLAGGAFYWYEGLRRARAKDFPFQWGPLFYQGLLLVFIGLALAIFVRLALQGGSFSRWIAAIVIAVPSLILAVSPYIKAQVRIPGYPDRLVGEGFHQLGMAGLGLALGLLVMERVARAAGGTERAPDLAGPAAEERLLVSRQGELR